MDEKTAVKIVNFLSKENGPQLTVPEAMKMVEIPSDCNKIVALQKGYNTFLVWLTKDSNMPYASKIVYW